MRIARLPGMVKDFSLTIIKHSTDVGETEARVEKCLVVVETKKAIELFPEAKLKLIYTCAIHSILEKTYHGNPLFEKKIPMGDIPNGWHRHPYPEEDSRSLLEK